jgi:GGDEF domain-containing protein
MSEHVDLETYPLGDEPVHNLQRMFADTQRVAYARGQLDELIKKGEPFSILAIDLDKSTVVRRRGVAEKRRLVVELHDLIRAQLPSDAMFFDSGSRDEGWIVLPAGADARALAESMRTMIREHPFILSDGSAVQLTASLGVITWPEHGGSGQDLLWSAGEALWYAKLDRDMVYVLNGPVPSTTIEVLVDADKYSALHALAADEGRTVDSLVHEAQQLLLENHAPRWHWIVEMGGPTAGTPQRPRTRGR